MAKTYLSRGAVLLFVAGLAGCSMGGGAGLPRTAANVVGTQAIASTSAIDVQDVSVSAAQTGSILIDAGNASGASGWSGDAGYSGGSSISTSTAAVNTTHVSNPAPQAVYGSQRYGSAFSYTVSGLTPNAAYTVRLHLAETFFSAAGSRVFNVAINGANALSKIDVYKLAGGKNIALIESLTATANSSGAISVGFSATTNYASIAGIEMYAVASSTTTFPIYSSAYTGNTPFHHTVEQLMAAGAKIRSSTIADNYWAQGIDDLAPGSETGGQGPIYTAHSGDPGYRFSCPAFGTCDASGLIAHYPNGAKAQSGTDHHLISFDTVYLKGEIDGWGGDGQSSEACNLDAGSPGKATCSWGGFFPFNGNGLAGHSSSGNAGGYAVGLIDITAQELLQGHIDHALAIDQSCLDDGGVYPSIVGRKSDSHCASKFEPTVRYGDLVHVKSSVNVNDLGYSKYCLVIVKALQQYGAYTTMSNRSWGLALQLEYMNQYTGTNPWFQTVFPSMDAGGDGSGSSQDFRFKSCLSRLRASDIEVIEISSKLPAI